MNIVWLGQDLRIEDNPAIYNAFSDNEETVIVYILNENYPWAIGDAQKWWLHHSLHSLSELLQKKNIKLHLFQGEYLDVLKKIHSKFGITKVYANTVYHPNRLKRQNEVEKWAQQMGITCHWYCANHLQHPSTPLNQQGQPYKVFTQFWKQSIKSMSLGDCVPTIRKRTKSYELALKSEKLEDWHLLPQKPNWAKGFSIWKPGTTGAKAKLKHFLEIGLKNYATLRDFPAVEGHSALAPHIHFGELSPRQIWHEVKAFCNQNTALRKSEEMFLRQLGWREFSYHLLYHYPTLPVNNFVAKFDKFEWVQNKKLLKAWQQGQTGYPIIDAGMRQLWQTGYMHNRVRMIVASFLIKDLFIHWREGEKWFWHTLLDADLANNAASWQWVAGSGADAAPYFRIFNPTLQSKKFDPEGEYIKQWVPELAHLDKKTIHEPWLLELPPKNYPKPIVEHSVARDKALALFQKLK